MMSDERNSEHGGNYDKPAQACGGDGDRAGREQRGDGGDANTGGGSDVSESAVSEVGGGISEDASGGEDRLSVDWIRGRDQGDHGEDGGFRGVGRADEREGIGRGGRGGDYRADSVVRGWSGAGVQRAG